MKTLIKLSILFLSTLLSFNIYVFAQGGYQDPQELNDSYDQALQGSRGVGTPNRPLRGRVVVAPAGSRFDATLISTLSSGINRVGDIVTASVSSPLVVGSDVVIPPGSQIIGQVVNSIPAARFMAGSGGVLEIRFTSIQTPDGQRYPLSASVDTTQFKLQAETGGSRLAKGVGKAAVGAGLGAALGTAIGAIAGGMPGKGAWSGAAIGGGLGTLGALASKGKELIIQSGTQVPVLLDQSLQVVVPQRN
ncbi:MAG: hypothetical protein A3I68_02980 [Candidatus Melainabacteria bacterium RIFCSPLOWO2_02_FULL_35_15]|nr:MAG: hypothetical protein A3F80_05980 [Candidatus Melainabacteria bacterium RIFCSPLOWO2_12_FULL_35_11]OGI13802.1 MAG: hypothetical protein A3I68_02980 [Candidatus Melainabacteria bacterium RIFCSPLOWO2_02_FULL_35_15]